jgi:hypothetical protein
MFTNACFKLSGKTNKQEKLNLILGNFIFLYYIVFGNLVPIKEKLLRPIFLKIINIRYYFSNEKL